ncbi:MAG: aminoglycoside 6-adenylyltransferase [Pseudomonadota bacterium]
MTARLSGDQDLRALFLGGSFGRELADAFSDIDLVAIVDENDHAAFAGRWRDVLEGLTTVVFWAERRGAQILINAVAEDWLRCDMYIVPLGGFTGRAQSTVKPLLDREGLYATLPATLPPYQPSPAKIRWQINEFIRIIGLLPVVLGRGELLTAVDGAGLTRGLFTDLMLEEVTEPDRGGALHLSRLLPAEDMALLMSLPPPTPDRDQVIAAHMALAHAFFPRARRLAAAVGVEWPEAFEAAARKRLTADLGVAADW